MASTVAESAGSVAPDSRRRRGEMTPEPPPPPAPHSQVKTSPKTPDRASPYQKAGACFTCQQVGHWSRDCPSKKSAAGTQLGAHDVAAQVPECTCGAGPCVVLTSKTEKNPGRKFFSCPAMPYYEKCIFFQWCDSPSSHQSHVASPVQQCLKSESPIQQQAGNTQLGNVHPTCNCGAGWCIVLTIKEGEEAGRKYFSCARKKCDFKQWCDEFNPTGRYMARPMQQDLMSPPRSTMNVRYPNCTCGAGRCSLLTMELGEYAGRKYFACPVKKGQGACNFFQWQNAAEGDYANSRDHLVGNKNQHADLMIEEPRDDKLRNIHPTMLNFDDVEVGDSNAGYDKARLPSPLEQRRGDARGASDQGHRPSFHNSSPNDFLKPGKCYRCGKEGHWIADCVEPLPPH